MAQIDIKDQLDYSNTIHEPTKNETKNGRISVSNEGTGSVTTGSSSAKSSIRELLQSQKSATRRKSKSQNRARKALRTITFILGMF
jgi:predicted sulfurtransferase